MYHLGHVCQFKFWWMCVDNGEWYHHATFIFIDINIHLYSSIQFLLNFIILVDVFKRVPDN